MKVLAEAREVANHLVSLFKWRLVTKVERFLVLKLISDKVIGWALVIRAELLLEVFQGPVKNDVDACDQECHWDEDNHLHLELAELPANALVLSGQVGPDYLIWLQGIVLDTQVRLQKFKLFFGYLILWFTTFEGNKDIVDERNSFLRTFKFIFVTHALADLASVLLAENLISLIEVILLDFETVSFLVGGVFELTYCLEPLYLLFNSIHLVNELHVAKLHW